MNQQKNSQPHIYNISLFLNVEQDTRNKLKNLVHDLIIADEDSCYLSIEKILDIVIPACSGNIDNPLFSEFSGLLIEYLLDYFLEIKTTQESEFYNFLSFLSHFPVTEDSPYYPYVQKIMNEHKDSEPELMSIFNRLQLLYVLTENGDFENAEELLEEMEFVEENKHLELWALFQLSKTTIFRHQNKPAELLQTQLKLILKAYKSDSRDSAINFIIRWLISINWFKQNIIKKTLLLRIKDFLLEQKSLNTAMVLYELFSLEDRLVPSVEKIAGRL